MHLQPKAIFLDFQIAYAAYTVRASSAFPLLRHQQNLQVGFAIRPSFTDRAELTKFLFVQNRQDDVHDWGFQAGSPLRP